jgi:hypothetical protein
MSARELEAAASFLSRRRAQARAALGLASVCALLSAVAAVLYPMVVVPFGAGSLAGLGLAAYSWISRRERVARLALDRSAYGLPEVAAYGRRFVVPRERAKLAASLETILFESPGARWWYLEERIAAYGAQLAGLAQALRQADAEVQPESMVACHHLLTEAGESPLYNPRISADELPAAIRRIRNGIARRP